METSVIKLFTRCYYCKKLELGMGVIVLKTAHTCICKNCKDNFTINDTIPIQLAIPHLFNSVINELTS